MNEEIVLDIHSIPSPQQNVTRLFLRRSQECKQVRGLSW
jgi:hypothetical protein